MQKQTNRKGQFGRPPHNVRFASTSYAATALCCRMVDQIGQSLGSLLGSCCCSGPVHHAHGRKFTTFPYWVQGKEFFGQTRSPKAKKASKLETAGPIL